MTSRTVVHGCGTSRAPATQDVVKFTGDSKKAKEYVTFFEREQQGNQVSTTALVKGFGVVDNSTMRVLFAGFSAGSEVTG